MPQKKIYLTQVGEVTLYRRRGNRNLRLSITSRGSVRVSLPIWTPYDVGAAFARKNRDWITRQLAKTTKQPLYDGCRIGKAHRLYFSINDALGQSVKTRVTATEVKAASGLMIDNAGVQEKLRAAGERALKLEAEQLLPRRLEELSTKTGYSAERVIIKRLSSRWGSCSSTGNITLNSYLMQLPWRLIDYVLVHELVHTKHKHHGASFWDALEIAMPGARQLRKELRQWQTQLSPA